MRPDLKRALACGLGCALLLFACDDESADSADPDAGADAATATHAGLDASAAGTDASITGSSGHDGGRTPPNRMDAAAGMADAGHRRDAGHAQDAGHAHDAGDADDAGRVQDSGGPSLDEDGGPGADPNCFAFRAHKPGAPATGFSVQAAIEQYVVFSFAPQWPSTAHAVSYQPMLDDSAVVAEMRLRATPAAVSDGAVATPGAQTHEDTWLLGLWAPGAPDVALPPDVGIRIGTGVTLEVHYDNLGGVAVADTSGFLLCAIDQPYAHDAAWHWLGTTSISGTSASGSCDPSSSEPIQLLSSWPSMHLRGTQMKITIHRVNGTSELILDHPYDFNFHALYDTPAIVQAGDTLTTACTYDSPVTFGADVNDGNCFAFVLAYPAGALGMPNATFNPIYGRNLCLP